MSPKFQICLARIRSRKFRGRIALENFKRVMARKAIEQREREIRSSATRRQPGQEPFATRLSPGFNDKNRMLFPAKGWYFA